MAQILVRNIEADIIEKLRQRARRHGRSLESEARHILSQSAGFSLGQAKKVALQWHKTLSGKPCPDTADLLRQDRGR